MKLPIVISFKIIYVFNPKVNLSYILFSLYPYIDYMKDTNVHNIK